MPTAKQQLLEHLYPGSLADAIEAHLAAGKSWRVIAEEVAVRTGVDVSYESLRTWYGATAITAESA